MAGENVQTFKIKDGALDKCIADGTKVANTLASEGWQILEKALNEREKYLVNKVTVLASKVGGDSTEELRLAALELKQFQIVRLFPARFIEDRKQALLQKEANGEGPEKDGEDN